MKRVCVKSTSLAEDSALWSFVDQSDFLDCYSVQANTTPRVAAEIITDFPNWAQVLLQLRRLLVTPFGLSQGGPEAADKVGPFPVEIETDSEVIAGFNDKHLDFRVSVMAREGVVSLATWVHVHNLGGQMYLRTILPFHIMIARDALYRVAIATQKSNTAKGYL